MLHYEKSKRFSAIKKSTISPPALLCPLLKKSCSGSMGKGEENRRTSEGAASPFSRTSPQIPHPAETQKAITWREDGRRAACYGLLALPGKLRYLPDENTIIGGGFHVADLLLHLGHGQIFEPNAPFQLPDLLSGIQGAAWLETCTAVRPKKASIHH